MKWRYHMDVASPNKLSRCGKAAEGGPITLRFKCETSTHNPLVVGSTPTRPTNRLDMATEQEPDSGLYAHADALDALNRRVPLEQKLAAIHEALYAQVDFVDRISVAAYDRATDLLKTFLASAPGRNDLVRYEARLSELPSLAEILRSGRPRVVNDLGIFRRGRHLHTRILEEEGYLSSYTVPMYLDGSFWGFIFFNSRISGRLSAAALLVLDVYAHLISAVVP